MEQPAIFSATLGLSHPWHVTGVVIAHEDNRMDIKVDFYQGNCFICPCCGSVRPPHSVQRETWFHRDFFHYTTYLHARVPRASCCGSSLTLERPWAREGSRFSLLQEQP